MKSRLLITCLILILCLPCLIYSQPVQVAYCGDVNSDEKVDIVDALLIAQHYVGLIRLADIEAHMADVNVNRSIDIIDALLVAQSYVGLPVERNCISPIDSISMKMVVIISGCDPKPYIGDQDELALRVDRLEPVTIQAFYGNTEDGYAVYVMDEYNYEVSFYITGEDYNIFQPLVSEIRFRNFKLIIG